MKSLTHWSSGLGTACRRMMTGWELKISQRFVCVKDKDIDWRNERGEMEFKGKNKNAKKVQYPGLTLGQQPIKSNMRTLCLHQFFYKHLRTGCVYLLLGESKKPWNTEKQWKNGRVKICHGTLEMWTAAQRQNKRERTRKKWCDEDAHAFQHFSVLTLMRQQCILNYLLSLDLP